MNTLNFDLIIFYLGFPQSVKTKVVIVTSNRTEPPLTKFLSSVQNSLSIYHCLILWHSYNLYRSRCTLKWHPDLYEQLLRSSTLLWKSQISKHYNFLHISLFIISHFSYDVLLQTSINQIYYLVSNTFLLIRLVPPRTYQCTPAVFITNDRSLSIAFLMFWKFLITSKLFYTTKYLFL